MNWELLILGIMGIAAHLFSKYWDSITQKEKFNWKKNLVYAGYSTLIFAVFIYTKDSLNIGVDISKETAFLIGYFFDSVVKNFTKFNPFNKAQ